MRRAVSGLIGAFQENRVNLNKVYLLGTLSREPEVRETHSGSKVVRVVVAVSRDYFSKERNQRVRETDNIEIQAWGRVGETLAQQLKKGAQIFIEGRLKVDTWETPSGEKRQRLVVHLENFAPAGAVAIPAAPGEEAPAEEGATPTVGAPAGPGASGKRKRRRRRGRREGVPAGPVIPQTPEERAAFSAGLVEGGAPSAPATAPAPSPEPPAPATEPTRTEAAPAPPPPPPPPAPPERKPVPNVSLKDDMPF